MSNVARLGWVLAVAAVMAACYHDTPCVRLTALAKDSQKMEYVRTWAVSRISDERFMDAVREGSSFERIDPRMRQYIDLDWHYLGLDPDLVWIGFNSKVPDPRQVSAAEIGSVSIGHAGSTIIIGLRAGGDLGVELPPEELRTFRPVGHDVFMYCE
jgi:hypothetical protein